jgi:uncharacterized membrane protein
MTLLACSLKVIRTKKKKKRKEMKRKNVIDVLVLVVTSCVLACRSSIYSSLSMITLSCKYYSCVMSFILIIVRLFFVDCSRQTRIKKNWEEKKCVCGGGGRKERIELLFSCHLLYLYLSCSLFLFIR